MWEPLSSGGEVGSHFITEADVFPPGVRREWERGGAGGSAALPSSSLNLWPQRGVLFSGTGAPEEMERCPDSLQSGPGHLVHIQVWAPLGTGVPPPPEPRPASRES